jgi:hypothetical protein
MELLLQQEIRALKFIADENGHGRRLLNFYVHITRGQWGRQMPD